MVAIAALAAALGVFTTSAGAVTIPVTGTAEGKGHTQWTGTFGGPCDFEVQMDLTVTTGPLTGGRLHQSWCWSLPDGGLHDGNGRASLQLAGPPPDGTFYAGEITYYDPTACNHIPNQQGCGQAGDVFSDTRTIEFSDRIGPRFGPARLGELTIDADSTFLDPFFYDGTFDADLSVTATLTGQLHS